MSSISSIFTNEAISPENLMHVFLYARQCYRQFENNEFNSNDLYDLSAPYMLDDNRFLFFKSKQDDLAKQHRKRLKISSERLMYTKIIEQHVLAKLASLINFADLKQPSEQLKDTRKTVQRLRYNNEKIINDVILEDAAYCSITKKKSRIETAVAKYKSTSAPPLFLHASHPEDAIDILYETMGALSYAAQRHCDIRCHVQMDIMGYNSILIQQRLLDDTTRLEVKFGIKESLSNILDDSFIMNQLNRKLGCVVFDALWDIAEKHQMVATSPPKP